MKTKESDALLAELQAQLDKTEAAITTEKEQAKKKRTYFFASKNKAPLKKMIAERDALNTQLQALLQEQLNQENQQTLDALLQTIDIESAQLSALEEKKRALLYAKQLANNAVQITDIDIKFNLDYIQALKNEVNQARTTVLELKNRHWFFKILDACLSLISCYPTKSARAKAHYARAQKRYNNLCKKLDTDIKHTEKAIETAKKTCLNLNQNLNHFPAAAELYHEKNRQTKLNQLSKQIDALNLKKSAFLNFIKTNEVVLEKINANLITLANTYRVLFMTERLALSAARVSKKETDATEQCRLNLLEKIKAIKANLPEHLYQSIDDFFKDLDPKTSELTDAFLPPSIILEDVESVKNLMHAASTINRITSAAISTAIENPELDFFERALPHHVISEKFDTEFHANEIQLLRIEKELRKLEKERDALNPNTSSQPTEGLGLK
jgi:hypothetical protein